MGILIPVPLVETGPNWAQEINVALETTIDQHDHSPGNGVLVSTDGLNVNADLSFAGNNGAPSGVANNATDLRSVRFRPQPTGLTQGTDLNCLYSEGLSAGNLVYNDGQGNQIFITKNGAVAPLAGDATGTFNANVVGGFHGTSQTSIGTGGTATGTKGFVGYLKVNFNGSAVLLPYYLP